MAATTEKDTAMLARLNSFMAVFTNRNQETIELGPSDLVRSDDANGATERAIADAVAAVLGQPKVDIGSSFFELGGHSIHAARLLTKLRQDLSPDLPIRAIFEADSLRSLARRIDEKAAVVPLHRDEPETLVANENNVSATPDYQHDPKQRLSVQQEQIWSHARMFPDTTLNNLGAAWKLCGALDEAAFSRAFARMIERHDVLRAVFHDVDGEPFVTYEETTERTLVVEDISEKVGDAEMVFALTVLRDLPMALEKGEVFRARLLRRSAEEHIFFFAPHHIVWDGLSWDVFVRDLVAFYEIETDGAATLPQIQQSYADFADEGRRWVDGEARAEEFDFWRNYYSEETPALALPADVKRPKLFNFRGGSINFQVSATTADAARALAASHRCTTFVVYLAAWQAFLSRVTGQADIVVGAPVDGRRHDGTGDLIGCFGNVLGVRAQIDPRQTFASLIEQTRDNFYDVLGHQDAPIELLARELRGARDVSRTALFQAMFTYLNEAERADLLGDVSMRAMTLPETSTPTDIRLEITENGETAKGAVTYANAVMKADGAKYLTTCFEAFLRDALGKPKAAIATLSTMTPDDLKKTVVEWNRTTKAYRRNALTSDYLDDFAAAQPDAQAVSAGDDALSYAALQTRANRIAHLLRSKGVNEGDIVAVYQDRTIDMVASILGVWKAGAALLPIDPGFPQKRLAYMLEDANAKAVITTTPLVEDWLTEIAPVIDLHARATDLDTLPTSAPFIDREIAARRAYVIYTSGSTGNPKGVENSHRALCNFIESMVREPGMSPEDRVLAVTTISFDVMLLELFVTLSAGAEIVLASDDDAMDGFALADIIERRDITVLQGTPATWRILFDAGWRGKTDLKALCGGEAMPAEIAERLPHMVGELWNMYGPTETTVWSTCARINSGSIIHVGRPIQNTKIYILDDSYAPTPAGVAGNLWIGGDGVALGYLGKPDLTAERFRDNPFDVLAGRIYNTGDRARWRRDGTIEILGRRDEQIKVRGYRIELGDIEAALSKHPSVRTAAAALRDDHAGEASIVAYVVFNDGEAATNTELRRFMREHVPHYMTPQFFMELSALPLTNNNKVDRKVLPAPADNTAASDRVSPRSAQEIALAEIWNDILRAGDISVTDNFFELGGQSLQAARMIARARDEIGLSLTPRAVIFESLEQLAAGAAA